MSTTDWCRVKLKYLVALKSGDAIDGQYIKDEGDYPVYGSNGLRGYTGRFTHEGLDAEHPAPADQHVVDVGAARGHIMEDEEARRAKPLHVLGHSPLGDSAQPQVFEMLARAHKLHAGIG